MRMLVLGGTVFLSRAIAAEAVQRGHQVVCAARGRSGSAPPGAELVVLDRDDPDGLAALHGRRFDAVADVAAMSLPWVNRALEAFAADVAHWTFVSTINVYADAATRGLDASAALLEPVEDPATCADPINAYGGVKVAAEQAVRAELGDRAFVVRPGVISGPGDVMDRFGYWVNRISRGGVVRTPPVDQPVQHLDVRDLAGWIVRAAEDGRAGTFDAIGPDSTLGELLAEIAAAVAPPGTELVPVPADELAAAGVERWDGPGSFPLWAPDQVLGYLTRDPEPARRAGLRPRSTAETARAVLETERELGLDRPRRAGLDAAVEARVRDLPR